MKPHLTRKKGVWRCIRFDNTYIGIGTTPSYAYYDWKQWSDIL